MSAEWDIDDNENTENDKVQKIEYTRNHWIYFNIFSNSFNKELTDEVMQKTMWL